jgi:hypothetical protein
MFALPIALPNMPRRKTSFVRLMGVHDRCSLAWRCFRYPVPAAILSKPFQKKFEEETVQQETVKLGPHRGGNS